MRSIREGEGEERCFVGPKELRTWQEQHVGRCRCRRQDGPEAVFKQPCRQCPDLPA